MALYETISIVLLLQSLWRLSFTSFFPNQIITTETMYGHKRKACLEQNISITSIVWN